MQKRDVDVVAAYNMTEETKEKISHLRINLDKEHEEWFKEAERMTESVDTEMKTPRITAEHMLFTYWWYIPSIVETHAELGGLDM